MKIILLLSYIFATQIYSQTPRLWQVKHRSWDNSHEQIYQDFIKRFAQAAKNNAGKSEPVKIDIEGILKSYTN